MKKMLMFLVLFGMQLEAAEAQTFDGAAEDLLPQEITAPFPINLTRDAFETRLKEGGKWTWTGDVVFGEPDPGRNKMVFLAVDELTFAPGARLITNGNTITIFVNKLNAGDGQILAFAEKHRRAASGAAGSSAGSRGGDGARGDDGGVVSIHVIQRLNGLLTVDLSGQDGGHGGSGAKGPRGSRGRDGARGKSTLFDCRSGGENGGDGGRGGVGGDAGDGGPGGGGGTLFLFTVGSEPLPESSYRFVALGGAGGGAGAPGPGGEGGEGGSRGGGEGHCRGGDRDGATGPAGPSGAVGSPGTAGATTEGAVVRALDLEVALRHAHQDPSTFISPPN